MWTLNGNGGYWNYDGTKGQQFGSKALPYSEMTLVIAGFNNVSKVVINTSGAKDIEATLDVYIGETKIGAISITNEAKEYTFTDFGDISGAIVLKYSQTSSVAIYLKSINVYGEYGSICGHYYDNACDTDCNVCGATREIEGHSPVFNRYAVVDGVLCASKVCDNCEGVENTPVVANTVVEVKNEEDLKTVLYAGYSVKLTANIDLTSSCITLNGALVVTIDLNGHTIDACYEAEKVEVVLAQNGAQLTVKDSTNGNGAMIATGNGDYVEVISSIDGATVTIENGKFISNGCTAIYATRDGSVTINGGYYEAKELYNGMRFLLDFNEAETNGFGTIVVTGGTFVNFNPANHTNDGKGYTNKVAPGYITEKVGNTYVVSEFEAPATEKVTISNPFTLSEDIVLNSELVVSNGAIVDLNGHTLTTKAAIVFSGQIKGAGSLVVDKNAEGKSQFSVLNGATLTEVPVKLSETETTETFVFRAVEDQQRVDVGVNDEGVTTHSFVFKPSFAMKDVMTNAELFGTDGTYNNNISFGIIVSRTNANGTQNSAIIPVPDTLVYGTNKAFKMTLTGVTDDYEYSIRVVVIYDETIVVYQGEVAYLNKKKTN